MPHKIDRSLRADINDSLGRHPGADKLSVRDSYPDISVGHSLSGLRTTRVEGELYPELDILNHPDRDVIEFLLLVQRFEVHTG